MLQIVKLHGDYQCQIALFFIINLTVSAIRCNNFVVLNIVC